MRDIKFRAWDRYNGEMIGFSDLCDSNSNINWRVLFRGQYHNLALMQYTGLKDRQGVEIYEEDVVRVYDHEYEVYRTGVVKWLAFYYPAFDIYTVNKVAKSGFEPLNDEFNTFTLDDLSIEVIGNIHENPELIHQQEAP